MFCSQCGKEMRDGDIFCSSCGYRPKKTSPAKASHFKQDSSQYGAELYSSKGYPEAYRKRSTLWGILGILGGILFIIFSQAKHSSSQMTIYSNGRAVNSGILGGGNMFSADGQQMLLLIGVAFIILGVGLFVWVNKLDESTALTLYENKITGMALSQKFVLDYAQVTEVLTDTVGMYHTITLITAGHKYRVIVTHDEEQAAEIIRSKANKKRGPSE